ncbi:hypothetical protein LWI29_016725 [Acer saccharum]|uniref:Uncharacterized protein n=1 Tax=Acer saccharum TaxID=4024 RepID=A0AA39W305_ACESA|nr:hypothetical protein LWI29_016725 [Acer saccharum]
MAASKAMKKSTPPTCEESKKKLNHILIQKKENFYSCKTNQIYLIFTTELFPSLLGLLRFCVDHHLIAWNII